MKRVFLLQRLLITELLSHTHTAASVNTHLSMPSSICSPHLSCFVTNTQSSCKCTKNVCVCQKPWGTRLLSWRVLAGLSFHKKRGWLDVKLASHITVDKRNAHTIILLLQTRTVNDTTRASCQIRRQMRLAGDLTDFTKTSLELLLPLSLGRALSNLRKHVMTK